MRPEAADLLGIGWLDGFVIDPATNDIILVGRRVPGWPSLHLDDLVVNLRNVWKSETEPYCSLDPRHEDVLKVGELAERTGSVNSSAQMRAFFDTLKKTWGPQTTVVGGVPQASRHAHVMIDADYHMKRLSQGLATVAGIPSCIDIALADAKRSIETTGRLPGSGMSMSRFWFHVAKGEPTYEEGDLCARLEKCSVAVLTEKERATADGALVDSGGDDPHAQAFARQLSIQYRHAATMVPDYADLDNLFRLSALVRVMHEQSADTKAGLDLSFLLDGFDYKMESPMPPSMPGLANSKEFKSRTSRMEYILFPIVCGGVSMEMRVIPAPASATDSASLDRWRLAALKSRPSRDALSWQLTKP